MSDYIKEITALKDKCQNNKDELIRLQEREKSLQEEKNKILEELKGLNIKENELENVIQAKESKLQIEIKRIETELQ